MINYIKKTLVEWMTYNLDWWRQFIWKY